MFDLRNHLVSKKWRAGVSWGHDKTEPLQRDELDARLSDPAELPALSAAEPKCSQLTGKDPEARARFRIVPPPDGAARNGPHLYLGRV